MSRITSKYQVTVPKVIAEQYGLHPGDDIQWIPAGDTIRVIPAAKSAPTEDLATRLRLFDQATDRNRKRARTIKPRRTGQDRGWTREDLYLRGRSH
ncbi:MAG TPA: AbrB/MazE/SpoVT family DNA-binding domain-containing protein [Bryobacteraceae bacterium]|jgi:AbrB family looped-hinge helix DNA binding protein|nr:AbrB/MazE/SpoVT family DNA-binding domain-containing protein [Bryobacteraceae bacterium]